MSGASADSIGELIAAARHALADAEGYARTFITENISVRDRAGIGRRIRTRCLQLRAALKAIDGSDIRQNPFWNAGYEAGFADGANDESANALAVRHAAEQALYWLEAERDSGEPGGTKPDEIIRALNAALEAEGASNA